MADTQRTLSDLLTTLFQDGQVAGSITPGDVRDLIVSMAPAAGGMSMEGNAVATTIALSNTWYKVAGVTVEDADPSYFDMTTDNRLLYNDTVVRHMHIAGALSVTCATNNQIGEICFFKNGIKVDGTVSEFKCVASGDPASVAISGTMHLADGDYFEIYIKNETGANNMTVTYLNTHVLGVQHA